MVVRQAIPYVMLYANSQCPIQKKKKCLHRVYGVPSMHAHDRIIKLYLLDIDYWYIPLLSAQWRRGKQCYTWDGRQTTNVVAQHRWGQLVGEWSNRSSSLAFLSIIGDIDEIHQVTWWCTSKSMNMELASTPFMRCKACLGDGDQYGARLFGQDMKWVRANRSEAMWRVGRSFCLWTLAL